MTGQDDYEPVEWRSIDHLGFVGYEVSNYGDVRSLLSGRPRILSPLPARTLSPRVHLYAPDGTRQTKRISMLVARTFLGVTGNPKLGYFDGDPTHNSVWNLKVMDEEGEPTNLRSFLGTIPKWPGCQWPPLS